MKYLSLDVGEKRVGVAVSDEAGIVVRPLLMLELRADLIHRLGEVVHKEKPEMIIVGIPRHQNGEEGEEAAKIREFAKGLHHEYNIEVDFIDESATTIEAEKRLHEAKKSEKEIKELVDAEAAAVILESYLRESKK